MFLSQNIINEFSIKNIHKIKKLKGAFLFKKIGLQFKRTRRLRVEVHRISLKFGSSVPLNLK